MSTIASARAAHAFTSGFAGNCAPCHSGGVSFSPSFSADATCLTTGATATLNVSGGAPPNGAAGLDLSIVNGAGSLAVGGANASGTQLLGRDVTNSTAKLPSGGTVRYSAIYVAPSAPTTAQVHLYYLAANNDGLPQGDGTSEGTVFITVAAPPSCAGGNCGVVTNACGQSVSCGTCAPPQTCGGGGFANHCGCTVAGNTCAGKNCGTMLDSCGNVASCGTCPGGQTCNASNLCTSRPASVPALGGASPLLLAAALLFAATIQFTRRRRDREL